MNVVVLSGGVGGAKFVLGLERCGEADRVTAIVNTGDDFCHFGLHISPDIDTLLYTLSDKADPIQGWGREGESWSFMTALGSLSGPQWFKLGDGDLALHVLRSHRLAQGERLSDIVADFAAHWGVKTRVLPMSDDPVATYLDTDEGVLPFQTYFVGRQCRPVVCAIGFEGAEQAKPSPEVLEAIAGADAIFIAPSNPWLSIDPLLALGALRDALDRTPAPKIAISPIVGGQAVKGPTTKLMSEMGVAVSHASIAAHYTPWLDGLVHDGVAERLKVRSLCVPTLMRGIEDKIRVAREALRFASSLAAERR